MYGQYMDMEGIDTGWTGRRMDEHDEMQSLPAHEGMQPIQ